MRFWFFCQKWHLSSTPSFPLEDDGDNWVPEDILRATRAPHSASHWSTLVFCWCLASRLERGGGPWTIHHTRSVTW